MRPTLRSSAIFWRLPSEVEDDLPDTLRVPLGLDEAPPTVPCPQFAQELATVAEIMAEGDNIVEALWNNRSSL